MARTRHELGVTPGGLLRTLRPLHRLPVATRRAVAQHFVGMRVELEHDPLRDGTLRRHEGRVLAVGWQVSGAGGAQLVIETGGRVEIYPLATIRGISQTVR